MKSTLFAVTAIIVSLTAVSVHADFVEWSASELGVVGGSSTSQSWDKSGYTLNVNTSDGYLSNIGSGTFTGLWFGGSVSADGTYVMDLDGVQMNSLEFEFDASSSVNNQEPERFLDWEISTGGGFIAASDLFNMSVDGSTMNDLVLTAINGDLGEATVTITSGSSFTWFAFRHTQDLDQNGSVIERVLIDTVPTPGAVSLLLLGGIVFGRRRGS